MWFKNLRVYRLTRAFESSPEALAETLENFAFQPCGKLDPVRYGWVPPLGRHASPTRSRIAERQSIAAGAAANARPP